jgi:hypothetical protein
MIQQIFSGISFNEYAQRRYLLQGTSVFPLPACPVGRCDFRLPFLCDSSPQAVPRIVLQIGHVEYIGGLGLAQTKGCDKVISYSGFFLPQS